MNMTDHELVAWLQQQEARADSATGSEQAEAQASALRQYLGAPYGDEVEGRSQVVSRDLAETVDGMMPDLLRLFLSSGEVVRFEPETEQDETVAQQATDYVNYVFWRDNPGFRVMHDWFKDALLQRVGLVKVWWQTGGRRQRTNLAGLNRAQLAELELDPEVTLAGLAERAVPPSAAHPDGRAYDVVAVRTRRRGRVRIANVPPEEFLIDPAARSLEGAVYLAHRRQVSRSELIEMGFGRALVESLPSADGLADGDERQLARAAQQGWPDESVLDDHVSVLEEHVLVDTDGDGISERRRILRSGGTILENAPGTEQPFAALCPVPMPHRFYGLSLADQVADLQRVKTVLWRQMLDNFYLTNNARVAVDITGDRVNMDDLMTSRPGGIVRTRGTPGELILPLNVPSLAAQSFQMVEYVDSVRETRTGITRYNQGLDADSLNKTASGLARIMDAGQSRKDMIARIFAETGVRELFAKMLRLLVQHQDAARTIRLRDRWVPVDPRTWNAEMDVVVSVGLGTGDRDRTAMHLMAIAERQERVLMAAGFDNPLVTPKNYYNTLVKLAENAGLKSPSAFFTDPDTAPPAPPPGPDPAVALAAAELAQKADAQAAELALRRAKLLQDFLLRAEALRLKHGAASLEVGGSDIAMRPPAGAGPATGVGQPL